jgi:hypothetical protein
MSKKQPNPQPSPEPKPQPQPENALVLFGGTMRMLPKELEEMGLTGKITVREIPGVPQNWKPVNVGDFLLGRVVAEREMEFQDSQGPGQPPRIRTAKVLVFDTAVPGGFRSVWLGADLRIKLQNAEGKVYQITYQGEVNVGRNARLNAMRSYQVFEIQPKEEDV